MCGREPHFIKLYLETMECIDNDGTVHHISRSFQNLYETFYNPSVFGVVLQSLLVLLTLQRLYYHSRKLVSQRSRIIFHLLLAIVMICEFINQLQIVVTKPDYCRFYPLRGYFWAAHIIARSILCGLMVWTIVAWSFILEKAYSTPDERYQGSLRPINIYIYLYAIQVVTAIYMIYDFIHPEETDQPLNKMFRYRLYTAGTATLNLICCFGLLIGGMNLRLTGYGIERLRRSLHRVKIVLIVISVVVMLRVTCITYTMFQRMFNDIAAATTEVEAWFYLMMEDFIPNTGITLSLLWLHRTKLKVKQDLIRDKNHLASPCGTSGGGQLTGNSDLYYVECFI